MISGLGMSSSGIASAVRTAGKARETMDTMARQIATGQRVSSVKDDGAAWTRARAIESEQVQWASRRETLDRIDVGLKFTDAAVQRTLETLNTLRNLVVAARAHAPGTAQRALLQTQYVESVQSAATPDDINPAFAAGLTGYDNDAWGLGFAMDQSDPFFQNMRFAAYPDMQWFGNWISAPADAASNRPAQLTAVNLSTASDALLADALTTIDTLTGNSGIWTTRWKQQIGTDMAQVDRMRLATDRALDRTQSAIGSLTDADLGKASAARAQAEVRQQLAISTVRQALQAYGNFAGGLLGNVQRTQQGIMA